MTTEQLLVTVPQIGDRRGLDDIAEVMAQRLQETKDAMLAVLQAGPPWGDEALTLAIHYFIARGMLAEAKALQSEDAADPWLLLGLTTATLFWEEG